MPPSTIWIVPSQGGAAKPITQAGDPPGGHGAPSWSPDGKRIVFDASDFVSTSLWSVSLGGRDFKKIAKDGSDGVYSPDGASIFYSLQGLWRIHVSPTTGEPVGEPFQLASGGPTGIRYATLSADGKKIAYSILSLSSNLWSVPLLSGASVLTDPEPFPRDTSSRKNVARFSPDGRRIAFNSWRTGTSADIWVAEADGKNPTQLTSNPTTDSMPSWFPEGDRIAFLSDRTNNHWRCGPSHWQPGGKSSFWISAMEWSFSRFPPTENKWPSTQRKAEQSTFGQPRSQVENKSS